MSLAEELVFLYLILGVTDPIAIDLNLIDKEHRLPMREILFQFISVHQSSILYIS